MSTQIYSAYKDAERFAKSHYENFPVVSFLVKKELRKHIAVIYWFARTADDIADEGNIPDEKKIEELDHFRDKFTELLDGKITTGKGAALLATIDEMNLTVQYFYDLISAFRQDLVKKSYNDFDEIVDYCSRSANPIGRLLLELHDIRDMKAFGLSDKICTALQLINFYQDTKSDLQRGRIYYPLDEVEHFGLDGTLFDLKQNNLNLERLVKYNLDRAEKILNEGKELLKFLPLRLKYEIKWTILGGSEIINKIRKNNYNVLTRPKLSGFDVVKLLFRSFI